MGYVSYCTDWAESVEDPETTLRRTQQLIPSCGKIQTMRTFNRDSGGGRSFARRNFDPRSSDRGGGRGGDRSMFKTTCSNCGKECEVPFRPTSGKPVYCSDCFEKMGGRRSDSPRPGRSDFRAPSSDQSKAQFDALNVKLDRILRLLEPRVVAEVSTPVTKDPKMDSASSGLKEIKTPKVKKVAQKTSSTKKK